MRFWLKDFEHNISPATWEAADLLCQSGSVRNLREIESHFWVATVSTAEGDFETEVIITTQRIKAYACECFTPGRRLMCAHIAATLLKLRQFLEQRAEEKRAKAEAARSNEISRLTVQSVLEHATHEALEAFVRDYARRDRDFGLALKTWFAGSVTESENPFLLILDSVIPKSMPAKGYRDPDFRRIRKALDGLETQLDKYENERDFRSVFLITIAILKRILPLQGKTEGNRQEALAYFTRLALDKLTRASVSELSPELREIIWEFVFELGEGGLLAAELTRPALRFLSNTETYKTKQAEIRDHFDLAPYPAQPFLLHLFIASLSRQQLPAYVIRVLEDYKGMPERIRLAILELYYLDQWETTIETGRHFLGAGVFEGRYRQEIEDILLIIAEKSGKSDLRIQLLKDRFLETGRTDVFYKLREAAGDSWDTIRQELIKILADKAAGQQLAFLHAAEGQLDELALLVEKEHSVQFLQRYEQYFFDTNPGFVVQQYIRLLSGYLDDHFGTPAAIYVRQQLNELWQKGKPELAVNISGQLVAAFKDRLYLAEELKELQPGRKRKTVLP
ncbi:MAG: hypothetical protein ACK5CH_08550 [Bacteroidota bacterium]|jgi:hypothetical protein